MAYDFEIPKNDCWKNIMNIIYYYYQVDPIYLGFTLAFLSRISILKFHCHIFFIYYNGPGWSMS
jgi:hypothetical protein